MSASGPTIFPAALGAEEIALSIIAKITATQRGKDGIRK